MSLLIPVDDELSLRLMEPHHAQEVFAVIDANREHIGRWQPWVEKTRSVDDVRNHAELWLRGFAERKQWSLSILLNKQVVGGLGLNGWRTHDPTEMNLHGSSADIGYWLAADMQRRGIVTRAVRKLVDVAIAEYGMHRLTIHAEPENQRSWRVAERLGFRLEGVNRHVCRWGDRWIDHRQYAMLSDEWEAS